MVQGCICSPGYQWPFYRLSPPWSWVTKPEFLEHTQLKAAFLDPVPAWLSPTLASAPPTETVMVD